jgi:hypothetical protein
MKCRNFILSLKYHSDINACRVVYIRAAHPYPFKFCEQKQWQEAGGKAKTSRVTEYYTI